ncbi:MAG: hypothetical protein Q4G24_06985 [Paracoccus sp. (in: a-proteobacteria)]|uniref:hypothetical protein n=1 Tax=Paracoccus sp. TaxID=267 RepID=UPI0026E00C09|nr:hypothetical protein [Paracoccus sp. (in: a-proteobacteria)]MDO5621198.1 hypothetical protein [Paracoccus sp. (in: a-proteobacteria)]
MKWGSILTGVWLGVLIVPALDSLTPIRETSAYRAATGRSPFAGVTVTSIEASGPTLVVSGHMVKRRCEFLSLSAYVERNGAWERAWVDTSGEDASRPVGNRSPGGQSWGPWAVRVTPPGPTPDQWRIWAHHRCPEDGGLTQSNLFAQGPWPQTSRGHDAR